MLDDSVESEDVRSLCCPVWHCDLAVGSISAPDEFILGHRLAYFTVLQDTQCDSCSFQTWE